VTNLPGRFTTQAAGNSTTIKTHHRPKDDPYRKKKRGGTDGPHRKEAASVQKLYSNCRRISVTLPRRPVTPPHVDDHPMYHAAAVIGEFPFAAK
jgi:hypothetical protein